MSYRVRIPRFGVVTVQDHELESLKSKFPNLEVLPPKRKLSDEEIAAQDDFQDTSNILPKRYGR